MTTRVVASLRRSMPYSPRRATRVRRGIPRRTAAWVWLPLVRARASSMRRRSSEATSSRRSRAETVAVWRRDSTSSGRSSMATGRSPATSAALAMALRSSRTVPGQSCASRAAMTGGESDSRRRPARGEVLRQRADLGPVRLRDLLRDGEPQPRTVGAGRIEGLEDPVDVLGGDPPASSQLRAADNESRERAPQRTTDPPTPSVGSGGAARYPRAGAPSSRRRSSSDTAVITSSRGTFAPGPSRSTASRVARASSTGSAVNST